MRQGGVLLHISSLPGEGGIGSLGKEAYRFADFLKKSGMRIWQVLPMGPTGYGESPYQSASVFAGNPMLISIQALRDEGLLTCRDDEILLPQDETKIPFEEMRAAKTALLRKCFAQSRSKLTQEVSDFAAKNAWVQDYALFIACKDHFGGVTWSQWSDPAIRLRKKDAVAKYTQLLKDEIDYHLFCQYLFFKQWNAFRAYCNSLGILLFGDMPIYVAEDSADTWTHPDVFQLDRNRVPKKVAGVPPDFFSEDGQLWGNPLYRWFYLRLRGYDWWVNRMKQMAAMYDILRIDHFIGFANYYSVPHSAPNARNGKWIIGPGKALFRKLKKEVPDVQIIAEDLGCVNDRVRALLQYVGYPGMKVLSFGFGGGHDDNPHYPANWTSNCVGYTGTHDNDTVLGMLEKADEKTLTDAREYLGFGDISEGPEAFLRCVFASPADTAVAPMQDILGLGGWARMNLPGTIDSNWGWRMTADQFNDTLAEKLYQLNKETNRI